MFYFIYRQSSKGIGMQWVIFSFALYVLCSPVTAALWSSTSQKSPVNTLQGKKIAIIGAGPVGLYIARRITDEFQGTEIKIFEKRTTYTREQVVNLSGWRIPKKNSPMMKGSHSIMEIESLLKGELTKHKDVTFHVFEFVNIDSLVKQFYQSRDPDIIIFANGARTTARDQYFGGSEIYKPYGNGLTIRYEREPNTKAQALKMADSYRVSKLIGGLILQSVKSQVQVRMVIVGPERPQSDYMKKMNVLINARRVELGERLKSTPTTSFFVLQVTMAKKVQSKYRNIDIYLVGDAAITLPYQLGLNTGFAAADILVKNPMNYNEYAMKYFGKMKRFATLKHSMTEYYRMYASFSSQKPWEFFHWNRDYEKLLMATPYTSNLILTHVATKNRKLPIENALSRAKRPGRS